MTSRGKQILRLSLESRSINIIDNIDRKSIEHASGSDPNLQNPGTAISACLHNTTVQDQPSDSECDPFSDGSSELYEPDPTELSDSEFEVLDNVHAEDHIPNTTDVSPQTDLPDTTATQNIEGPVIEEVRPIPSPDNPRRADVQIFTKTSRKRKQNPEEWKKKKAAVARAKGESYVSYKGNVIQAKSIAPETLCHPTCHLKCSNKFDVTQRKGILNAFYQLDINAKNTLLFTNIDKMSIARARKRAIKHKSATYKYYVKLGNDRTPVYKKAFCSLYQIERKKVALIQSQLKIGLAAPPPDKRGKHLTRPTKTAEDVKDNIKRHISKFPADESHYSRHYNIHKKYISPLLSISKMHKLYLEDCRANTLPQRYLVKECIYRKIFVTEFNLSFGNPKSDTCSTCDSGNNTKEHEENYHAAFEAMRVDSQTAESNEKVAYLTVDLQQTMPLPRLSTSKAFYLRQSWFYNLGIHVTTKECSKVIFCTWTEHQANRGSTEIFSSLLTALELDQTLKNKEHLVIWSDSCSGQNKNFLMVCLYQYLIHSGRFKIVDHKFPEVGHTYLDSDIHFGRIEKRLRKHQNIYLPDDYRHIIGEASKNSLVLDMTYHFRNTDDLAKNMKLYNRKKDVLNQTVRFRDGIKWIRVEAYGSYLYKENYDPYCPYRMVDIRRYVKQTQGPGDIDLPRQLTRTGVLSTEKKQNLREQLPYIPEEHRWYYNMLISEEV